MRTVLSSRHIPLESLFKALADPIRRSLIETLAKQEYFCTFEDKRVDGICVQDLTKLLDLPQSTISRHLAILRQAGLVGHKQNGVWHYYFINQDALTEIRSWLDVLTDVGRT